MAVRIGLYPYDLSRNKAYEELIKDYKAGITEWDLVELRETRGESLINQLIYYEYLAEDLDGKYRMAFDVLGTVSHLICLLTSTEVRSFKEILRQLPKRIKYKSVQLKHQISFLSNFNKIQYFDLPCSSFTCIVGENNEQVENTVDEIFEISNYLEPQFIYKADVNEGVDELRELQYHDP